MRLVANALSADPPALVPARAQRAWMDGTDQRFAYRCIPLSIANASGWELILSFGFNAYWNGGPRKDDIRLEHRSGDKYAFERLVTTHFGHGVLTFHTDYLFRTEPGWATVTRGSPNQPKDGIVALEGLVETDWLPFPFTMNWLFTRPGMVTFEAGEAFCFVTPTPHLLLEKIIPEIAPITADQALEAEYRAYAEARATFNASLVAGRPEAVRQGWQRHYVRGDTPGAVEAGETHRSKRRLATPVKLEKAPPLAPDLAPMFATDSPPEPVPSR